MCTQHGLPITTVPAQLKYRMMMPDRQRPWKMSEANDCCFILTDAKGFRLAHFFYANGAADNLGYLTKEEAREAALTIQKLSLQPAIAEIIN